MTKYLVEVYADERRIYSTYCDSFADMCSTVVDWRKQYSDSPRFDSIHVTDFKNVNEWIDL